MSIYSLFYSEARFQMLRVGKFAHRGEGLLSKYSKKNANSMLERELMSPRDDFSWLGSRAGIAGDRKSVKIRNS